MFGIKNGAVKKVQILELDFQTKRMLDLEDKELRECSDLFSRCYGKYSKQSTIRPGEQIAMGVKWYKENYVKPDRYISTARYKGKLVGHALYIRKSYPECGKMTWVLQLVVDDKYRRQGIASTLLRSIWGFSDDFAWGLATANPCTVRTLESATFRKCKPKIIKKYLSHLRMIGDDTTFIKKDDFVVTNQMSQVNSRFFIDNSDFDQNKYCSDNLGELKPGHEWLAFTFQTQDIQLDKYKRHFDDFVEFSEKILKEAYSRMQMQSHGWTKGTINECDFMVKYLQGSSVLDLGCGIGRHSIELAKRGYSVLGVDFSKKHIETAFKSIELKGISKDRCNFVTDDVREFRTEKKFDNVLLMFDVIGSYPNEEENVDLLKNASEHLNQHGILVLSVMNMELTSNQVPKSRQINLRRNPEVLLKLKPSSIMQKSGDIFNPEYLAIDTGSGLVYRKEQFSDDDGLSAEYVIRDKRYTMDEISAMVEKSGFDIIEKRFVRAGHFDEKLDGKDSHAKEIFIIARKQ